MIDHVGFPVSDYERSKAFYGKALAPLGYTLIMEIAADRTESGSPAAGFGKDGKPDFWIGGEGGLKGIVHVAITADDRRAVDAFYRAALAAGGKNNGGPGLRPQYHSQPLRRLRARSRRPQRRGGLPRPSLTRQRHRRGTAEAGGCWFDMRDKGNTQASIKRVWDIIEQVGVAMLTTQSPGGLRARPLEARPERDAGMIWLITDATQQEHEIEAEHDVGLVFIAAKEKAYLSLSAGAEVRRDPAKAAEIWRSTDNAWWSGPDDPNVCVLRVRPMTAELWDGPASAAVAAFEFAKARITGETPQLGENRKVAVKM